MGNRETPAILSVLVLEDLAMTRLPAGRRGRHRRRRDRATRRSRSRIALVGQRVLALVAAIRYGHHLTRAISTRGPTKHSCSASSGSRCWRRAPRRSSRCRRRSARSWWASRCRAPCNNARVRSSNRCATCSPRCSSCCSGCRSTSVRSRRCCSPRSLLALVTAAHQGGAPVGTRRGGSASACAVERAPALR